MARIAVAGFLHETNTFAASRARLRSFIQADAWPPLLLGEDVVTGTRGMNIAMAGFCEAALARGQTLVPLLWCDASPSGPVTEDAYEALWLLFERELSHAGPVDAIYLDLHGAMVAEHLDDGEGEWLRRVRERVGRIPVVASLDFHGNVSAEMVDRADALCAFRTYPHVDMAETGAHADVLVAHLLSGLPLAKAFRQVPFLIPLPWQCTLTQPMASLMAASEDAEAGAVVSACFLPGFPPADVRDCGPSIVAYALDPSSAERAADELLARVMEARERFAGRLWSPKEAVAHAIARLEASPGPVVLADTQDNPGGGGDADTTGLLRELLVQRVREAVLGVLCDARFAEAAQHAGVGASLDMALGGRTHPAHGAPVEGPWTVEALGTGCFEATGPFYRGCRMDLGPMALVRREGVRVVVSSRKQQAADQAMFRHLGVDPAAARILALKSSVHFRADFGAIAREVLVVEAPGENVADPARLSYRKLRPGVAAA
jgi:microcystin degradation protein MlrC